ncbi:DUF6960 family protein [Deinococcus planocerae]|uniref:DUF6960 family protein n=1 Tax=Deinococcus planocerae TaxID=1737569 RepID=UPI0011AF0D7F|nr:hypothetical protein [Deinococcus planocerae]
MEKVRRFGLYPWFEEHGSHLIHPDDLDAWRALGPYGRVFELRGEEGEYFALGYGDQVFRVRPGLWRELRDVPFGVGDRVQTQDRNEAIIHEALWHHQHKQAFYLIAKRGKRSTKRYFKYDLT